MTVATMPCPRCGQLAARTLNAASEINRVEYYRCVRCGLVWHIPKDGSAVVTIVAEPRWSAPEA